MTESLRKGVIEQVKTARLDAENKTRTAENLRGIVEEKKSQIPQPFLIDTKKIDADLKSLQTEKQKLDAAWQLAEENFHTLEKKSSEYAGKVQAAEKSRNDANIKIAGKTPPNIPALQNKKILAQDAHTAAISECTTLENNLKRLQDISAKLVKLELPQKIFRLSKNFPTWQAAQKPISLSNATTSRRFSAKLFLRLMNASNV